MAQYVDQSLAQNEHIVVRGRWPMAYWVGSWIMLSLFVLFTIGAYALTPAFALLPIAVFLIGAYFFVVPAVRMLTTEFAVTNKRVVLKWGWLNRRTAELAVESVESVQLEQSIWGRLFGYGRLLITGTGDSHIRFPPMAEPVKFRRAIEANRGKTKDGAEAAKAAQPSP
jgi:uncharacterized membrane protein YdbT with pleckstrin-like domain